MVGATMESCGVYYNQYPLCDGFRNTSHKYYAARMLPTMMCLATPPKAKRLLKNGWENQRTSGTAALCLASPPSRNREQASLPKSQTPPMIKDGCPSPTSPGFYAGAKFNTPPAPATLPKPPTAWMSANGNESTYFTQQLKMALNVKA